MQTAQLIEHLAKGKGDDKSIQEAANLLLTESPVKAGQKVAIIDDDTSYGMVTQGTVKGAPNPDSGFVDVELPNGTTMPMQSSLLIPLR